jgi:hypothetical protein
MAQHCGAGGARAPTFRTMSRQNPLRQTDERERAIKAEILARLMEKGSVQHCSICGHKQWIIGKYAALPASNAPSATPVPYAFNPMVGGPAVYPMVTIYCEICGTPTS